MVPHAFGDRCVLSEAWGRVGAWWAGQPVLVCRGSCCLGSAHCCPAWKEGAPLNCSRGSQTPTLPSLQILASDKTIFSTAVWASCVGQVYVGNSLCSRAFWRRQRPRGLRPSLPLYPAALTKQPTEASCHLELARGCRWQARPCCVWLL